MLKLAGNHEKRLDDLRPVTLPSLDALLRNEKLGRRLSVDGRGVISPPAFGIAFLMLTGGYFRSRFSLWTTALLSCCEDCDCRFEEPLFRTLSARLPRVLLRRWPVWLEGLPPGYGCCGVWNWPPVGERSLCGRLRASISSGSEAIGPDPDIIYPELDFGCENDPCALVLVG